VISVTELGARESNRDVSAAKRAAEVETVVITDHRRQSHVVHGLTVATRNVADFTPTGVPVVDPWSA
jgi:hypothetical protein